MTYVLITCCMLVVYYLWRTYKDDDDDENVTEDAHGAPAVVSASPPAEAVADDEKIDELGQRPSRVMLLEALKEMNCEYEIDKDAPGYISFRFQTEMFTAICSDDYRFIRLTDPSWYTFSCEDIDKLMIVRKVVNEINWSESFNMYFDRYDYNGSEEHVGHDASGFELSSSFMLLTLEQFNYKRLLESVLKEFFHMKHTFYRMMAEEKQKI